MEKSEKNAYKKPPLVYINRVKMAELDSHGRYDYIPDIKDENGNKIYRCKLSEEQQKEYDKKISGKINRDNRKHMILSFESELIRIVRHLSAESEKIKKRDYIPDVLVLKVGKAYSAYRGKMEWTKGVISFNGKNYKRILVSSSHSRTQKAMFIYENIWDKAMDILHCGIPKNVEYRYMSKWNSYLGLAATDSIPVSMPNIVIVDDKEIWQKAKVDVVQEVDMKREDGSIERRFSVLPNRVKRIKTNLFDGAGLVTIKKAAEWGRELNLDYIPSSFQFRCIPCLKGKLYTMPVEEFAHTFKVSKLTDIYGKECDLFQDEIDCILLKSQFKFYDLYQSIDSWRNEFQKELHGYKRTFNISEYDVSYSELKDTTVLAYQPLHTLNFTDKEIAELCTPTTNAYKKACSNVMDFLKYRGVLSENDEDIEWKKYPKYYQAMYYNPALFNDEFIKRKVKQDLKAGRERAYVGKIMISGNYQTLTPDLFALLQHVFGLEVTGLLKGNEVYSNYWNQHLIERPWIDIIRSPHIAREHCPAQVVTCQAMEQWFAYQKTGIIVSVFGNSIALKLNSADYDGDHVLTTDNRIICKAAREQLSNTIYHEKKEYPYVSDTIIKKVIVNDWSEILECDFKGYKNNIGNVINPISILWSMEQSKTVTDAIKIMSIIGSITIDYAKHGEEAAIPPGIVQLLKGRNKPYFMKYLRSNRKKRSIEKEMKTYELLEGYEYKTLFEDSNCTMNRICHYMEKEIGQLKVTTEVEEEFKVEDLLAKTPDVTTHRYKQIKDCLIGLQEEFYDITNENYLDTDISWANEIEKNRRYDTLYDYALGELLSIENNRSDLLDTLLAIYYTDKKFIKRYHDKSILWGCFSDELIQRVRGEFESKIGTAELAKIEKRRVKAEKSICAFRETREKNFTLREFEREENKNTVVHIYKEDIAWIKKNIPSKNRFSTECRRLMLALVYICRKCSTREVILYQSQNNCLNRTSLCRLVQLNRKLLLDFIVILAERGILKVTNEKSHLRLEILKFTEFGNTVLYKDVKYQRLYAIANDRFRENSRKIVKKSSA